MSSMLWSTVSVTVAVILGQFMVTGQSKNIKYGYQGITKLGIVGEKLVIECPLTGPFYLWRLFQSKSESRVLLDQDSKSIIVDSATVDRTGIYECKSTTGFGNAVINITLKIIDPNSELSKEICSFSKTASSRDFLGGLCFLNDFYQKTSTYKVGSNTELDCEAVGSNPRYTWKYIDQNGVQRHISKVSNITRLMISNILPENEGSYKCEVTNDQALKIYRSFTISISDIPPDSGIEVIGPKYMSYSLKHGDNISLICSIRSSYQRIHSIKWGKRLADHATEIHFTGNIVSWDQHNYRVLPSIGIIETHKTPNQINNTLILSRVDESNSGIYICLAMNTFGGTVYKIFNISVSTENLPESSGRRSQFFFLYILSPAILILFCVCAIIYCCVKSNSAKSSNPMPLKQYNSSTPSNGNKSQTSNYYYPSNVNRTNCPTLPPPEDSQASQVSPNTVTSYSSYGNYHFIPSNQPSYCNPNDV